MSCTSGFCVPWAAFSKTVKQTASLHKQLWLLRDHLNNIAGYIIICFIHYWLVEWFCCYYRGITLHCMKHLIYWAGFGIMLYAVSKEETIICSTEILSPQKVFSFVTNKNWLFYLPFLLNFPNDFAPLRSFHCCLSGDLCGFEHETKKEARGNKRASTRP